MKILLGLFTLLMLTVALMGQQVEFKNPKMIEVGKISQGEKIQGTIEFTNTGSTPVEIAEVKASCGCTAVKTCCQELPSHSQVSVSTCAKS